MKELKLGVPAIAWHTVRDCIAEVGCFLGLVTGTCGKIALDVKLLMQTEVEEVYEPFLIMEGYLNRTPQGRVVTELAFKKLGLAPVSGRQAKLL